MFRLVMRRMQACWHPPMSGPSHEDAATVDVVGRAVVAVVVVDVVDVVAFVAVDEEVDDVEVEVVVVGGIGFEHEFRHRFATLFCWPIFSFEQLQSEMLRNAFFRQTRSSARWSARHCFTQLSVIVQRPPPVERHRGLFAMAAMQSSKSACASDTHSRYAPHGACRQGSAAQQSSATEQVMRHCGIAAPATDGATRAARSTRAPVTVRMPLAQ